MLVVISDLHFVDGTSGNHNLPSKAFEQVFLSSIVAHGSLAAQATLSSIVVNITVA